MKFVVNADIDNIKMYNIRIFYLTNEPNFYKEHVG